MHSLVRLVLLVAWASIATAAPCADAARQFGPDGVPVLVPEEVFGRAGINIDKLTFRISEEPGTFILSATADGQSVGHITIIDAYDGDHGSYPIIDKVEINDAFKSKGVGTFFYMAAARHAFENSGKELQISTLTTSDAKAVWARFITMGYAETFETEYGESTRMRRTVINSDLGNNAWKFVEARLKDGP